MSAISSRYDEIPYPNLTFLRTQPIRTAALASLYGIEAPDPRSAKILELGCAAGANLIPMAVELPDATLVGVDLSVRQIKEGRKTIAAVGLHNISLKHEDVANIDQSWGKFDYIIAHGLFSWVPEPVQDHILRICHDNLSPNGIAYVSYNVFPGWHPRRAVRDIMLYHVAHLEDPKARIEQSRAILDFMAEHAKTSAYADMLQQEAKSLKKSDDSYLFHEFLERDNNPILFTDFVDKAHAHQLEYLSDSEITSSNLGTVDAKIAPTLQKLSGGHHVRLEQYLDFLQNRSFRKSLLVHRDLKFNRYFDPHQISKLWLSSISKSEKSSESALVGLQPMQFVTERGHKIQLRDPLAKTAMVVLEEQAGVPIQFPVLLEQIHSKIGLDNKDTAGTKAALCKFLLEAYNYSALELFSMPWPCVSKVSEKPLTTSLARYQARTGEIVVSQRHRGINGMNADYRQIIEWLDGEHTIDEVIDLMTQKIDIKQLPDEVKKIANDSFLLRTAVAQRVQVMLADLAQLGLLIK